MASSQTAAYRSNKTSFSRVRAKNARRSRSTISALHVLLFLLAFRIVNALALRTFFVPDEYYQSLEPAWQLAFGPHSGAWITWVRRDCICMKRCDQKANLITAMPDDYRCYIRQAVIGYPNAGLWMCLHGLISDLNYRNGDTS